MKGLAGPACFLLLLCLSGPASAAPEIPPPHADPAARPAPTVPPRPAPAPKKPPSVEPLPPPIQPLGREAERSLPGLNFSLSIFRGLDDIVYPRPLTGLRLGAATLHTGLGLEGGYDTNATLTEPDSGALARGYLRLLPRLQLSNRRLIEPRTFEYLLGVLVDYLYEPVPKLLGRSHQVGVRADVELVFRTGALALTFSDRAVRTAGPIVGGEARLAHRGSTRLYNAAELALTSAPPKGRNSLQAAYRFTVDVMEDASDSYANRMRHDLRFGLGRRFRKWLTLGLSAEVGYVDHFEESPAGPLQNRVELRLQLTAEARLGPRVRLRGAVGYGGAYLDRRAVSNASRYHLPVAELGGQFLLATRTFLWAGYWHDLRSPWGGEHLAVDAGVLRLHLANLRRLVFHLGVAWVGTQYAGYSTPERRDHYVQVSGQATGYLLPWLSLSVGYVLQVGLSDLVLLTPSGTPLTFEFLRHRVFGRLAVHY